MSSQRKPNFFIVGAPKCGTTSLYDYLRQHPQIFMSEIKEPNYFRHNSKFKSEADYLKLFDSARDEIRIGEATPGYLRAPEAAQALHAFDPSAKIIIMLREPVDLMYSSYWQHRMAGREKSRTFAESLTRQEGMTTHRRGEPPDYKQLPRLSEHVVRYFECFGREHVHVILFDDLKRETAKIYRETLEFLGVDPDFEPQFLVSNARKRIRSGRLQTIMLSLGINVRAMKRSPAARRYYHVMPKAIWSPMVALLRKIYMVQESAPPLDAHMRYQLQLEFRSEVNQLSRILERDLSHWISNPDE